MKAHDDCASQGAFISKMNSSSQNSIPSSGDDSPIELTEPANLWLAPQINFPKHCKVASLPGMYPMGSSKHRPLRHPADPHQDLVTMQEVGQASPAKVDRSLMVQQVVLKYDKASEHHLGRLGNIIDPCRSIFGKLRPW